VLDRAGREKGPEAALDGSEVKLIPSQSLLYVVRGMILAHSFPVAVTRQEVTINQDMKALVLAVPEVAEWVLRTAQAARRNRPSEDVVLP
jgi:type I restriction enzyme, S subunit